ncbi:MAG: tubulin-like doman-containing protein [Treponema sp.]|jgi:hypothetical protein|nr:tubulin-like doman-containing protein [Treponema sp.]
MAAPTLIVGLGGIGSQITAKLSAMITDERIRERINFVVLDTDANELDKIRRKHPHIRGIQTSTNMTVGDYLHLDAHTRDTSFPLNHNLYRKTLSEGAGQVRAISYLAFVTAMKRGQLAPLDDAIYDLYKLESGATKQVLRVIIVSSMAGGTGSGLILPVSMYIRQFLKTRIQIPGNITRGFFILPEILYTNVPSETMRNAFKANAYAVLRELNAFILKADDNLPPRYKNKVNLEFPNIGSDGFEKYDVLPMDFCFMFDAQNINGSKLNSTEQYLQHAATCIYAQSIGPMNTRSNSSEDNVIRTLVSGQSRNRYAGAGASELVYPSDHILNFIALKWAAQTVTGTWTLFDKEYKSKSIQNNQAKMKGLPYDPDIKPETEYIKTVDTEVNKNEPNPFAKFVRRVTYNYDKDGFTERGPKWNVFITALRENVKANAGRRKDIAEARNEVEGELDSLRKSDKGKDSIAFLERTYNNLINYRELVKRRTDDIGRVTAYSIFKSDDGTDVTQTNENTRIEKYLKDDNKFIHPNAVRYFFYQTLQSLEDKKKEAENKRKNCEARFESLDKLFDDPFAVTDDKEETIDMFTSDVRSANILVEKITKKYAGKIDEYIQEYAGFLTVIDDYRDTAPYIKVLEEAKEYVGKLCKSFEAFYDSFDANVDEIQRRIKTSEEQYRNRKGNTIRYVCASKNCLDKFYDKMEFTGSAIEIPDQLCRNIYKKVRDYSLLPESSKTSSFFKDTFDNEILKHFRDSVEQAYGPVIKMDIIRALEVEAEYEEDIHERSLITEYVKKVIKETKELSAPFINQPQGEESVPIPACAYNENLKRTDDPEREELVNTELKPFGGVESKDEEGISKERILFYSAIYGLFPDDLLKFTPPNKSQTGGPDAGEYYKVYFDMINRIGPNPLETKVITPHLHKFWHLISEMPDLNDKEQEQHEKKIYKALLLGILYKKIQYQKTGDKCRYRLWLGKKETPLDVSDGTCDTFYEIVDALTRSPIIVNDLLEADKREIEEERKHNVVNYKESKFFKGLEELKLEEISNELKKGLEELKMEEISNELKRVKENPDVALKMSIFGIAMAYKVTMPPDEFIDEQGQLLLETIMETLYEQVTRLCPEIERDNVYAELIEHQLETFKQNIGLYEKRYPTVIKEYLERLLHVVIEALREKGLTKTADEVDRYSQEYFSAAIKTSRKTIPLKKGAE